MNFAHVGSILVVVSTCKSVGKLPACQSLTNSDSYFCWKIVSFRFRPPKTKWNVLLFSGKSRAEINKAVNHDGHLLKALLCNQGLTSTANRRWAELMFCLAQQRGRRKSKTIIDINFKSIWMLIIAHTLAYILKCNLAITPGHVCKVYCETSNRGVPLKRARPVLTMHLPFKLYLLIIQTVAAYSCAAFLSTSKNIWKERCLYEFICITGFVYIIFCS